MKVMFISLPHNVSGELHSAPLFKTPPITYLWLATILDSRGHDAVILDALALNLNKAEIFEKIKEESPDVIGFSAFTSTFHDVVYMSCLIKEKFPDMKVAVGGYHVNSLPEDFYLEGVDYVFSGETEYSFCDLLTALEKREEDLSHIGGLHFYDEKKSCWVRNAPVGLRTDFDSQPFLKYEMILPNGYTTWWRVIDPQREKFMATVTGRGCPLNCSFCDISKTEGLRYRAMSPQRVVDEFAYAESLGITHMEVRDPFFTANASRLEEIAQGFIDRKISIEWGCSSTIQKIKDRNFLKLLKRSGCKFLFYGVESGNPEILMREKKVKPQKVFEVVRMTQEEGIQAHCSFIFGLEGETAQTLQETLDFSLKLNPDTASYSIAVPYPGTKMYDSYKEKGYMKTYDWRFYGGSDPVFETPEIKPEMLLEYIEKAHKKFYFRPSYLLKRLLRISSLNEFFGLAKVAMGIAFDSVLAYKR